MAILKIDDFIAGCTTLYTKWPRARQVSSSGDFSMIASALCSPMGVCVLIWPKANNNGGVWSNNDNNIYSSSNNISNISNNISNDNSNCYNSRDSNSDSNIDSLDSADESSLSLSLFLLPSARAKNDGWVTLHRASERESNGHTPTSEDLKGNAKTVYISPGKKL